MHACMITYLLLYLWQDLYNTSQARIVAPQVVDEDEDEEKANVREEGANDGDTGDGDAEEW